MKRNFIVHVGECNTFSYMSSRKIFFSYILVREKRKIAFLLLAFGELVKISPHSRPPMGSMRQSQVVFDCSV